MSTEFESNTDNTEDTFSAQDDDKRILFKWGVIVATVVVITCFATTSLLKVLGIISASWLWVLASTGVSSVITGIVVLLVAVLFTAAFINAIRGIG